MSKLPILMYHNIVADEAKSLDLSISISKLESHFKFLHENNYTTFRFKDLENLKELPKKVLFSLLMMLLNVSCYMRCLYWKSTN